jgi:hypothetical protein
MEAIHRGRGVAEPGEHDDGAVGVAAPDRLEKADPVQLRHPHVRDDERGLPDALEQIQRLEAAAGLETVEPLSLEHPNQGPSDSGLVIYDEAVGGAGYDRLRIQCTGHG